MLQTLVMTSVPDYLIDRFAPTCRPEGRCVMRNVWQHLTFLHWAVPVEQLRPLIPRELEIDVFEGKAYIGLVPFTMRGVRPLWLPTLPLAAGLYENFHETNVRTYVHFRGGEPGVWFFSLDASNLPAVATARAWYKLPYFFARMSLQRRLSRSGTTIEYSSRRYAPQHKAHSFLACKPLGPAAPAAPGTLEHFLAERYILYSRAGRTLYRGRVHHAPYPLQRAEVLSLDESLLSAAGIMRPNEAPLAHYAREVSVEIFPLEAVNG
ncbi:MAG TPA: DUF2071 domain-containing protein [Abditibacteriaceae bacterium]